MQNGGFVLGGVPAKELGIIMISSSRRPMLPNTVDRTMAIPGRHGAWDFGADLGPRAFALDCALVEQDAAALQLAVERVASLLLDKHGRPRELSLRLDIRPEREYKVRYVGSLPVERIIGLGRFTLPLIAYDPFGYAEATAFDVDPGEYDTGLDYDTGAIYPNTQSFHWQYTYHMSSLYNYSPLVTPLRLDIEGAFTNLTATNVSTGQSFSLAMTNPANRTVVIDAGKMQVYQTGGGSQSNLLMHFDGDFITLEPGQNKFIFQGSLPNATIKYIWKNKFA